MTDVLVVYFVPLQSSDHTRWTCLWLSFSASSRFDSGGVQPCLGTSFINHSMAVTARLVGWVVFPRRGGLVHALLDEDTTGMEWAKMLHGCLSLSLSIICFFARQTCQGERSRHSRMVAWTDLISVWHFLTSLCKFYGNRFDNGPRRLVSDEQLEQHRPRSFGGRLTLGRKWSLSGVVILFSFVSREMRTWPWGRELSRFETDQEPKVWGKETLV